ncbi:MAG: hypothetical protein GY810_30370 [Aureispira sp.]|nr:hypothetical protein [Aureispira sp.]
MHRPKKISSENDLEKSPLPQKDSLSACQSWKQRIQETGGTLMCSPLLLEADGNGGLVPLVICCVLTFYLFGVTGSKKTK